MVDDSVMNSCATSHAPSLLADGINFIKNDDVQTTVSTKLVRKKLQNIKGRNLNVLTKLIRKAEQLFRDWLHFILTNKYSKYNHGCCPPKGVGTASSEFCKLKTHSRTSYLIGSFNKTKIYIIYL